MLENLVSSIAAMNGNKTIFNSAEIVSKTSNLSLSIIECAHIQFPTFDGTNFHDWRAKAE